MRRFISVLLMLLCTFSISGFLPVPQTGTNITIINRNNQIATQITDGDLIRIQITLLQPVTEQDRIDFKLGQKSLPVGTCVITKGSTRCTTESFPSLGWHWDPGGVLQDKRIIQAVNDNGEFMGQSNPITVLPRPVVMVHGFLSNWKTWTTYLDPNGYLASLGLHGFAVGDGQVTGELNVGSPASPAARTNTIAQNAEILGQYISEVKQRTGAEMVDLVVHSMGGMISRYYIDRVMQERDVAQLIMLGSPMGGSDCAVLPAALGFYLPASIEIRPSYMMGVFNQQITHRRGVEFYDLGGTAISDAFKSPCTDVPNDTVVSFGSINAISLQASKMNETHSDLTFASAVFENFVKPLLQKPAGSFLSQPDPAPPEQSQSPLEFTRVYTGHVETGNSTELTINIEPNINVAAFALYDPSRSVTTIVRGASGNVIVLDPQTNGFIRVDDPASLLYLGYGFQNPRPGPWKVTVQATEATPSTGTDFAISVYFVGGAKLETKSSNLIPQLNEKVELDAELSLNGQPLKIKEAKAFIRGSEGTNETLDFSAGQNISTRWTPRNPGMYAVDIVVTGLAPDGSTIERTGFLSVEVQPNPGKLQITFNLFLLIAAIVLVLFGILYGIVKLTRHVRR
ncbi:MAG TPA: hypothetical protein VK249_23110 [Anaerolineales bacterium]|nr:hypothetical protein [Anaerolineales bacterium]